MKNFRTLTAAVFVLAGAMGLAGYAAHDAQDEHASVSSNTTTAKLYDSALGD